MSDRRRLKMPLELRLRAVALPSPASRWPVDQVLDPHGNLWDRTWFGLPSCTYKTRRLFDAHAHWLRATYTCYRPWKEVPYG